MEGAVVERVKVKVQEVKEKRLRKTKGNTKVSFGKTAFAAEVEAAFSDPLYCSCIVFSVITMFVIIPL